MADRLAVLSAALAGRYRLEAVLPGGSPLLGQGGMALVYAARDLKLQRDVAIKVLRPDLARLIGPERFLREIRIAAGLSHPHILPLFDSGAAAGSLYYVMPRVRGESLRQRLERQPVLPLADALRIAREVADALDYAHGVDVIHRDIKPENIMLADGHALVADFGVARSISGREHEGVGDVAITGTGLAVGTVMYMSPEQRSGQKELDGRTDLYSLGCVLFEMLTGAPPALPAGSPSASPRSDPVLLALHQSRPDLSSRFDPLLQRALAAAPQDRFASAAEMLAALHRVDGRGTVRGRWLAVVVGTVAVLLLLALGTWLARRPPSGRAALLLVADFSSAPGDSALSTTVRDLVAAELNQPSVLTTMSPEMVAAARTAAGMPDTARLDVPRARELAERTGIGAVITGSIRPLAGTTYAILLRAFEPTTGRDLVSLNGTAPADSLVVRIGELARSLRGALGDRGAELAAEHPLWQVTTPSLSAFRDYVQALREANHGGIALANQLLRQAVAKDTAFASAWAALATNLLTEGSTDSAVTALARARAFPGRLRDVDRYAVEAQAAYGLRGDRAGAIQWYDLILRAWPNCLAALNNRGLYRASLGRYEEALADFDRALALVSFGKSQGQIELLNRAAALVILGRLTEARAAAEGLAPRFRGFFELLPPVAETRWASAESTAQRVEEDEAAWGLARRQARMTGIAALVARGGTREGLQRLRTGAAAATGAERRWYERTQLLLCQAARCDPGPPPAALLADSSAAGLLTRGLWAIARSDTIAAHIAAQRIAATDSNIRAKLGFGPALLTAMIAGRHAQWRQVVDLLAPLAAVGEHDVQNLDRVSTQSLRWPLAEAYTQLGRLDSAAVVFDALAIDTRIPVTALATRGITYAFALQRAAELYRQLGRTDLEAARRTALRRSVDRPDPGWDSLLAR